MNTQKYALLAEYSMVGSAASLFMFLVTPSVWGVRRGSQAMDSSIIRLATSVPSVLWKQSLMSSYYDGFYINGKQHKNRHQHRWLKISRGQGSQKSDFNTGWPPSNSVAESSGITVLVPKGLMGSYWTINWTLFTWVMGLSVQIHTRSLFWAGF